MDSDKINSLIIKIKERNDSGLIFHAFYQMRKLARLLDKIGNISSFDQVSDCRGYEEFKVVLVARRDNTCHWRNTPYNELSDIDKDLYSIDKYAFKNE